MFDLPAASSSKSAVKSKVKVIYPQHKVRGATQHDRTLDGMFLPILAKGIPSSSSDPKVASSGLSREDAMNIDDDDDDEPNASSAPVQGDVDVGTARQPAAATAVRVVESQCILKSVLELRAEIEKRKHNGAHLSSYRYPEYMLTLRRNWSRPE